MNEKAKTEYKINYYYPHIVDKVVQTSKVCHKDGISGSSIIFM